MEGQRRCACVVCCVVLQCVAHGWYKGEAVGRWQGKWSVCVWFDVVCHGVLRCVAVCCSVLQCAAVCCGCSYKGETCV